MSPGWPVFEEYGDLKNYEYLGGAVTVLEFLQKEKVDLETLERRFDGSPYWMRAKTFITQHKDYSLEFLTSGQIKWLKQIRDDLIEYRINNRK